jgi:TonB family protein
MRTVRHTPPGRWAGVALGIAALWGLPHTGRAQGEPPARTATVAGVVHDEAGNQIASVEVTVAGAAIRVLSDAQGAFLLRGVPVGAATIRFRRLGFVPRVLAVAVDSSLRAPLDVALSTLPMRLAGVEVRATRRTYGGYMAEFYRRRDSNVGGRFFTRAQIDSLHPYRTTDLLRRVPGLTFTPGSANNTDVRMRDRRCQPLVWLDGMPAAAAYFDPDDVDPSTIEGIEVYSGLASVPPALIGPRMAGACGVVAIWTRVPEPRRKGGADGGQAAQRLAALVDSLQVYTAAQVDVAASPDSARPIAPAYPRDLREARTPGVVIAEFVVDALGRAEPATVGIVSSTHPLFADAVRDALTSAAFHPAVRAGRPVRQVVQLPVYFRPPPARADEPPGGKPAPAPSEPDRG